jgi:hypothetical protein
MLLAALDAAHQLLDGLGLIALRFVIAAKFEIHVRRSHRAVQRHRQNYSLYRRIEIARGGD